MPEYRFLSAQEFIQAIRHRNLQRMLFWTLCSILALGFVAAFAIIPANIRQREQEKAQEEERQRREEDVRRAQESLMREIQLIMDEK